MSDTALHVWTYVLLTNTVRASFWTCSWHRLVNSTGGRSSRVTPTGAVLTDPTHIQYTAPDRGLCSFPSSSHCIGKEQETSIGITVCGRGQNPRQLAIPVQDKWTCFPSRHPQTQAKHFLCDSSEARTGGVAKGPSSMLPNISEPTQSLRSSGKWTHRWVLML